MQDNLARPVSSAGGPAPMNQQPPSEESLRSLLQASGAPDSPIDAIRSAPSLRLERIYDVKFSDGSQMVLLTTPNPSVRLLRSEQTLIMSEAVVLRWLKSTLVQDAERTLRKGAAHSAPARYDKDSNAPRATGDQPTVLRGDPDLIDLLPVLISHSSTTEPLGSPYKLLQYPQGLPLAALRPELTLKELRSVAYQTGQITHRLSRLVSPSGTFGPALSALCPPTPHPGGPVAPSLSSGRIRGAKSWPAAFLAMMEGILRDGEDMAIVLAYPAIRRQVQRLLYLLDKITTPRFVPVDIIKDDSICVIRRGEVTCLPQTEQAPVESGEPVTSAGEDEDKGSDKGARVTPVEISGRREKSPKSSTSESGSQPWKPSKKETGLTASKGAKESLDDITISGFRDWCQCIFGDILFSKSFCYDVDEDFLRGFDDQQSEDENNEDTARDDQAARTRILLYRCYHATVAVVREFYRPERGGSQRELAARKRLHTTLELLEKVETHEQDDDTADPKARHRRPSGVVSPAKKVKSDTEDCENGPHGGASTDKPESGSSQTDILEG